MNNTAAIPVLNLSNGSVSSEYPAPFNKSLALAILSVQAAEIIVGFPKNLQICFNLYERKDLRKVPHILLGNLSVIGLLVSGIYIPLHLAIIVMDQFIHKPLHGGFCVARFSSSMLFFGLYTLTLVAMAIDRHDCVVRPFNRRITVFNVREAVRGIWLVAGLTTTVHLVLAVNDNVNICYVNKQRKTASIVYAVALGNIYLFGTVIIIFTTFVRIVRKLRLSLFAESNHSSKLQVTRFSYMVLFFFIISWVPISSFSIITLVADFTSPEVRGIEDLLMSLSNLSYVVNPFIHINMLIAVQRAADSVKPRNEEQLRERPGNAWIEEQPEISEVQLDSGAIQPTG